MKLADAIRKRGTDLSLRRKIEQQRLQIVALMAEVHSLRRHRNITEKMSGRK